MLEENLDKFKFYSKGIFNQQNKKWPKIRSMIAKKLKYEKFPPKKDITNESTLKNNPLSLLLLFIIISFIKFIIHRNRSYVFY